MTSARSILFGICIDVVAPVLGVDDLLGGVETVVAGGGIGNGDSQDIVGQAADSEELNAEDD